MATITQDNKLMEKLKVSEIRHYILQTNKGDLTLTLRKGENKYKLVLDSVPLDDELNEEVMNILYLTELSKLKEEIIEVTKDKLVTPKKSYYKPKVK